MHTYQVHSTKADFIPFSVGFCVKEGLAKAAKIADSTWEFATHAWSDVVRKCVHFLKVKTGPRQRGTRSY